MKLIPIKCESCSADLDVKTGRKYLHCHYCGSKFLVQWDDGSHPQFTSYAALTRVVDMVTFTAADTRLKYIDTDISEVQAAVNTTMSEFSVARASLVTLEHRLQKDIPSRLAYTVGAAALGGFLWLFTIFNLDWTGFWMTLLVALGLTYAAWENWSEWKTLKAQAPGQLQHARERFRQSEGALAEAQAELKELELEKELCEGQVKSYRHTAGTHKL